MKQIYTVQFRRKREGKTNYRKRLKTLASGKLRFVVRKTLKNMAAQLIEFHPKGDKVTVSANSAELKKYGWKINCSNLPAAYLTGYILGLKAKKKGIKEAILDIGLNESTKGSKLYATLKGAVEAGLSVPHSKEILPDESRIKGQHIESYIKKFGIKRETTDISKHFSETLKKIQGAKE